MSRTLRWRFKGYQPTYRHIWFVQEEKACLQVYKLKNHLPRSPSLYTRNTYWFCCTFEICCCCCCWTCRDCRICTCVDLCDSSSVSVCFKCFGISAVRPSTKQTLSTSPTETCEQKNVQPWVRVIFLASSPYFGAPCNLFYQSTGNPFSRSRAFRRSWHKLNAYARLLLRECTVSSHCRKS